MTRFAGQKVVLLGLYNGQKLDQEPDTDLVTYARATEVGLQSPPLDALHALLPMYNACHADDHNTRCSCRHRVQGARLCGSCCYGDACRAPCSLATLAWRRCVKT